MSLPLSNNPCEFYLHKILESAKKVNIILNSHNNKRIKHQFTLKDDSNLPTPKSNHIKDYLKKKIDKICDDFELVLKSAIKIPTQHPHHHEENNIDHLDCLKDYEKNDENLQTQSTKHRNSIKSLKRTSSEKPTKKMRLNLVPPNKHKFMKEYYMNVVKPNHTPKPRRLLLSRKNLEE